jgi:hypothetical protein
MGRLARLRDLVLDLAYEDGGPEDAPPVVLRHGYPYFDAGAHHHFGGVAPPRSKHGTARGIATHPKSQRHGRYFASALERRLFENVGHTLRRKHPLPLSKRCWAFAALEQSVGTSRHGRKLSAS